MLGVPHDERHCTSVYTNVTAPEPAAGATHAAVLDDFTAPDECVNWLAHLAALRADVSPEVTLSDPSVAALAEPGKALPAKGRTVKPRYVTLLAVKRSVYVCPGS